MSILSKIAIKLIIYYQRFLSPFLGANKCRHVPSCSAYGLKSLQKYGFLKGSLLTCWRILRCNPFSNGGVDPVPRFFKQNIK